MARFSRGRGEPPGTLNLVVKINPRVGLARNLIPWIAARNHIVLERPFLQYRSAAELDQTAAREFQVYRLAQQQPELGDVVPRCYGWAHDPETGEYALFLECVSDIAGLDATGASADWEPEAIDAALRAAARWHAAFWGADEKRLGWAGPRPTTASMVADTSLWRGLLNDARARFPHIVTQEVWRRRYALIDTIGDWHKAKDKLPATLAHNDFNQRNVGFRPNGHAPEPAPEPARNGAAKRNGRSHRFLPHLFGSKKSYAAQDTAVVADAPVPSAGSNRPAEVIVLDWEIAQRNIAARDLGRVVDVCAAADGRKRAGRPPRGNAPRRADQSGGRHRGRTRGVPRRISLRTAGAGHQPGWPAIVVRRPVPASPIWRASMRRSSACSICMIDALPNFRSQAKEKPISSSWPGLSRPSRLGWQSGAL